MFALQTTSTQDAEITGMALGLEGRISIAWPENDKRTTEFIAFTDV